MIIKRKLFSSRFSRVVKEATRLKSLRRHLEAQKLMDDYARLASRGGERASIKTIKNNIDNPVAVQHVIGGIEKTNNKINKAFGKLKNKGVAVGFKRGNTVVKAENPISFRVKGDNTVELVGNKTKNLNSLENLSTAKKQVKTALNKGKREVKRSNKNK